MNWEVTCDSGHGPVEQIATAANAPAAAETVYLLLEHLAANGRVRFAEDGGPGQKKFSSP